ncbi:MAG: HDOD domain-containing protein, partial [Gilvibacter sp.]
MPKPHEKLLSFPNAIKHLSFICCQKWYTLIVPLLAYPCLIPVGSYVRLQDGSLHIVLSISIDGIVTKPLANKSTKELDSAKAGIQFTAIQQIAKVYPCQQLKRFNQLNLWWGTELEQWLFHNKDNTQKAAFDLIRPFQHAPASLLVIQDQLNHVDSDITLIIKAIEKDPTYAQQLQAAASLINRQKQTVQNTQHGLAMLGFERTNSLLLEFSLLSRLNQQYFPLQPALLTFSEIFINIVSKLASNTKITTPELARTAAYFLISRLFTLPNFRTLNHWER